MRSGFDRQPMTCTALPLYKAHCLTRNQPGDYTLAYHVRVIRNAFTATLPLAESILPQTGFDGIFMHSIYCLRILIKVPPRHPQQRAL